MPRHLLPKHRGVVNVVTSGQWIDFSDNFNRFQDNIEIPPQARINVTSIPSPWARMLLFKEAIMSSKHLLHKEVMSNILDVLEIIYLKNSLDFELEVKQIHLTSNNQQSNFHDILYRLYPDGNTDQNVKISLLLAKRNNETFVLAGTSPYTLFFTPLELTKSHRFPRYFKTEPVSLAHRPQTFQRWFKQEFIRKLRATECFGDLVNAFAFTDGICQGGDTENPDNRDFEASSLFVNDSILGSLFDHAKHCTITSTHLMRVKDDQEIPPLVFDTSINMTGLPYYNEYTFPADIPLQTLKEMPRDVLPRENTRYPWLIPYYDFLQPCMIRYRYKLNDDVLIMGNNSNEFKFLMPLTDLFFKFFSTQDVDELLTIQNDGNHSVKVVLRVPLRDGGSVTVERRYTNFWSETNQENCIIEYDDKDISTPLPHFVFWPKLHPDLWKEPYYCMVYGERYNTQDQEFVNLEFMNSEKKVLESPLSRKSKSVDIAELSTLPTYIRINIQLNDRKIPGYILLDHSRIPKLDTNIQDAVVGFDFGTSHTIVAIKINGNTEILKYKSNYDGINLNSADFVNTMDFSDDQIMAENIPQLMIAYMGQYLFPNRLGTKNTKEEACLPIPTMVVKEEGVNEPRALLHYSTNFSKSVLYPYQENARPIRRNISILTDLKWNHDDNIQNASEAYLSAVLKLLSCELIKRRVDPQSAKYYWAYPRSFSKVDLNNYDKMWNRMLSGLSVNYTDESKAALLYFDHKGIVAANNPGMVIVADIGGGSSDVSVWHDRKICMLNSSLWAGRDLVGYNDDQTFYSVLLDTLKRKFSNIADSFTRRDDPRTHLNYILYSLSDDTLGKFASTDQFFKVNFLIIYFFSSLFYEIGLQNRRFSKNVTSVDICLAGNGSRFACWSGAMLSINTIEAEMYKAVFRISMGLEDATSINIRASQDKKWEVAVGLCEGRGQLFDQEAEYQPVIAETISIQGHTLDPSSEINDFNEKYRDHITDLVLKEKTSELVRFHDVFFEALGKSDIYRHSLRSDAALSDLSRIKTELLGDWNNLLGQIRTLAGDNVQKLSSISSSLFILGMKVTIKRLHKYLSDNQGQ